ncbi:MAG: bifunctional tetrahydrofolate synthase/dihydrofolate synthase [endosymbiont of Seepiophila jonesi]|uniref:Dihydrofolate synthase/folylpolyglutamate synthase n=1 Tax=endosymbiont of Lamellibrachia luymesi TaxID=2200907 RepID=A0A370DY96_9GAMM|nr:MAG: bifunctional tetrahydrofolate synthase/dihydrofolate synthase [endosymbiont of Seepiophila jonesi]RDH90278.1 MAG: bifunctional tetrahydrofolate synthase/dihydrofolate synthase [endosymbiont of Lamellibrachia luymesi]
MRFISLDDWLTWQSSLHPHEIELGLDRVVSVWQRLRPSGLASPVVTIAGTNGKGSSVAMLESIFKQAGYRTGAYTSPHLVHYNERVRLNSIPVSDEQLCRAFQRVDDARGEVALTYFEFGTLAALDIFAELTPDLVILEVGLGGRLDAVNIIDADVAVITTVALDHTDWLGETLDQIGAEKAGIMRSNRPVIMADKELPSSVYQHAESIGAIQCRVDVDFHAIPSDDGWRWKGGRQEYSNLPMPALPGVFQLQNAAAVLAVVEQLSSRFVVESQDVAKGLASVHLAGRYQLIDWDVPVVLDVAHNIQAAEALRDNLWERAAKGSVLAVFAMLADKDVAGVIQVLDQDVDSWYLVELSGSRSCTVEQLEAALRKAGSSSRVSRFSSVNDGLQAAMADAGRGDSVLVFGSFLTVGEALQYLEPVADVFLGA